MKKFTMLSSVLASALMLGGVHPALAKMLPAVMHRMVRGLLLSLL